jgi:phospholipid/cholesterol/gamma-HCH transport system substrate-binding protein
MEPEAKYTLVGISVLLLIALLAGALAWLKSTRGEGEEVPYKIYFSRHSLEGLQVRSDVKMRGIRVGSVTGFRISPRRPGSVEVLIRVDDTAPVRHSTHATVERHLLTGIASIVLVNQTEDSPALRETPANEPYPVIAEGEPEYKLTESAAYMAQRADETMQRINRLLSDENQAAFAKLLANLESISGHLDRTTASIDGTLASIGRAATAVQKTSAAIANDAHTLAARYDALGAESATAVRDVSGAVRNISTDVSRLSKRMESLLADSDVELRLTAQQLRATADALGIAARRLSDPRRALFGDGGEAGGPGEARR